MWLRAGDIVQPVSGSSLHAGTASSELGVSDLTAIWELRQQVAELESSGTKAECDIDDLEQAKSTTHNFFLSVMHAQPFAPHHAHDVPAAPANVMYQHGMHNYANGLQNPVDNLVDLSKMMDPTPHDARDLQAAVGRALALGWYGMHYANSSQRPLDNPVDKSKIEELTPKQQKSLEAKEASAANKAAKAAYIQQKTKELENVPTSLDKKIMGQIKVMRSAGVSGCDELATALEWGSRCLSIRTLGKPLQAYLASRPQFYLVVDSMNGQEVHLAVPWDK